MNAELVRPYGRGVGNIVARPFAVPLLALFALLAATALGGCGRSSLKTFGFDGGSVQTGRAGTGGGAGTGGLAGNDGGVDRPDGKAGSGGGIDGGAGFDGSAGTGGRRPVQLVVSPAFIVIPVGGEQSLTATLFYSDGSAADVTTSASWTSSDQTVAAVKAGRTIGLRNGQVQVSATSGGFSSFATVVVMSQIVLVNLSVDPAMGVLATGSSTQLTVTGFYSDGSIADLTTQAFWSSTSPDIASVDTGRVTAWRAGSTQITANVGGFSAGAFISVTPETVVAITVLPPFATIGVGAQTRFFADATLSDGTHVDVTSAAFWSADATVAFIAEGFATGLNPGKTVVTATFGGATGAGSLAVTGSTLKLLQIEPLDPTVGIGVSLEFRVTGIYSDGTKADVTSQAMWQSSNPGVLALDPRGRGTTKSVGTSIVSATVGTVGATSTVSVVPAALKFISIQPSDVVLMPMGMARLRAIANYADGTTFDVTDSATWTSSAPMTVAVSNAAGSAGVVRALQPGFANVTATLGGIGANARVTVSPAVLTNLTIEPPGAKVPAGTTIPLVARATFSDGSMRDVTNEVFWTSTDDATATVTNGGSGRPAGLLTGVKAGDVMIAAFYNGVSFRARFTILAATLSSIVISPSSAMATAGLRYAYTATGVYSDGNKADVTAQVIWSTDDAAIATVSNVAGAEGQLLARSAGTTEVVATLGAVAGRTKVTVTGAAPTSLVLQPLSATTTQGTPVQYTATLILSNGTTRNVTGQAQWTSSNPMVAQIVGPGRAVPGAPGVTTISASYLGFNAATMLTVNVAVAVSVEVSPIAPTLPLGTVGQLTATAIFSDGTTRDVTNLATWVSTDPGSVGVNTARFRGRITALKVGKAEVSATYLGLAGATTVTVSGSVVTSISVSPIDATLPVGARRQYTAQAIRSDGTSMNVTAQATWTSSAPMVAGVGTAGAMRGQVVALAAGKATISATFMGLTGTATVAVTNAMLASIQVTPFAPTLSTGSTQPFVATAIFSDGTSSAVTADAVWRSSDENVAGVSNAPGSRGLVTTLTKGVTSIEATYMGVTGGAKLSVTEATVVQIQITPFDPTIPAGFPLALTATAIFSDGTNRNITSLATWTSSAPGVAGVSDAPTTKGLLSTFTAGAATIEARYAGVAGAADVTVTAARLQTIDVTPGMAVATAGEVVSFHAIGSFDDGSTLDITTYVTWTSNDLDVADVSNADGSRGQATTFGPGSASIVAQRGNALGKALLSVK
jgi:hypothetical protein